MTLAYANAPEYLNDPQSEVSMVGVAEYIGPPTAFLDEYHPFRLRHGEPATLVDVVSIPQTRPAYEREIERLRWIDGRAVVLRGKVSQFGRKPLVVVGVRCAPEAGAP